jgi:hypothetical protein
MLQLKRSPLTHLSTAVKARSPDERGRIGRNGSLNLGTDFMKLPPEIVANVGRCLIDLLEKARVNHFQPTGIRAKVDFIFSRGCNPLKKLLTI